MKLLLFVFCIIICQLVIYSDISVNQIGTDLLQITYSDNDIIGKVFIEGNVELTEQALNILNGKSIKPSLVIDLNLSGHFKMAFNYSSQPIYVDNCKSYMEIEIQITLRNCSKKKDIVLSLKDAFHVSKFKTFFEKKKSHIARQ
jgi:hypothetical protein